MTNVSFYVLLLTWGLQLAACGHYDIRTNAGWVRGATFGTTDVKNRIIYGWKSIPYAEPPVGNLRFEVSVQPLRLGYTCST